MSKFTNQQFLKTDQYRELYKSRCSTGDSSSLQYKLLWLVRLDIRYTSKIISQCNHFGTWVWSAYLWMECVNRIPTGWVITLSDLSSGMVASARRNLKTTGRNFKFKEIDAQFIPYDEQTFDVVIANHMLYHVPDKIKAIAEIKRVLKPNGRLIATTVGNLHLMEMNDWERRR